MASPDSVDRKSRRRRLILTAGVVYLLVFGAGAYGFVGTINPEDARMVDLVRMGAMVFLALVLSIRSTVSFSLARRDPAMDDELTRDNRLKSARWGYWSMLLATIAIGAASFWIDVALLEGLITIVFAGAMAATFRFVSLEGRGERGV